MQPKAHCRLKIGNLLYGFSGWRGGLDRSTHRTAKTHRGLKNASYCKKRIALQNASHCKKRIALQKRIGGDNNAAQKLDFGMYVDVEMKRREKKS
jgi:hypothetical protein